MAYELLSGRVPFLGSSGMDVLLAHATETPPTFAELGLGGWVPHAVEEVIRRILAKDPDDRPQSARHLSDEIKAALRKAKADAESGWREKGLPTSSIDPAESDDSIMLLDTFPTATDSSVGSKHHGRQPQSSGVATIVQHTPSVRQSAISPKETPTPVALDQSREQTCLPFHMDAWMPETIALIKLRGFVQDNGGRVLECKPGRVVVQLKGSSAFSAVGWLGLARRSAGPIDIELQLVRVDPKRENQLKIHVLFHPSHATLLADKAWHERCGTIFIELRGYLMGGSTA